MKNILSFVVIVLIFQEANAEGPVFRPFPKDISNMSVVDSGYIKVWYALNALDINKPETYDDLQRLEMSEHLSKYYSHFVYTSDSLCTEWRKENTHAQTLRMWMGEKGKNGNWSEYYYSEYFKDFSKNVLTEYARMARNIPNYQCSEELPVQRWDIQDDTSTVAGYLCQKATCLFRGRSYVAWFTLEIPIHNGPWKLGGLPGLILKAYDKDKQYVFECIKIESCKQKYPIKIYDYKNYKKIERKELLKLQKEIHDDYSKIVGLVFQDYTPPPKKESYRPLELE